MAKPIPDSVRAFVLSDIHSVAQLELLLWLYENEGQTRSLNEICRHHSMQPEMALDLLEDLRSRKLVERVRESGDAYTYQPQRPGVAEQVEELARFYAQYRYSVINLIFSRPSENVRSFAKSFRLRKEDPDG